MVRLTSKITVGEYQLAGCIQVDIESSWDTLTDTCNITLPSFIRHQGKNVSLAESNIIKRGDAIKVELGYDGENEVVFEGFVVRVQAGSPVVVECEDYAYLLKRDTKTVSFSNISLQSLLQQIVPPAIEVRAADVNLGQFRISKATPAQVLDEIKKTYSLVSWMRGRTLYAGLAYFDVPTVTKKFAFQQNIIEDELQYNRKDEIKIKVKAISMMPNNSKIETEVGDAEGEQRTLHFYNLPLADLKKAAEAEIDKLRYDGYRGSFTAFGQPFVQHGDIVEVSDNRYNRKGNYYVKAVTRSFGMGGYRQISTLDKSV